MHFCTYEIFIKENALLTYSDEARKLLIKLQLFLLEKLKWH